MKSPRLKAGSLTVAAALVSGSVLLSPSAPAAHAAESFDYNPDTQTFVNLLHFNDFHGRLQAPDARSDQGGTIAFAQTVEQARNAFGTELYDNSVLISGGDSIGASLYASASQQDTPTLEVLNALGVDASAVGNHEFDRGIADLNGRVLDESNFPWLAANVTLNGAPVADASYELITVGDITVAVIGAVTDETPTLVTPGGIEGVEFADPVAAVNRVADELTAAGTADVIVAEYHAGAEVSLAMNAPQETQATALQSAMTEQRSFRTIVEDTNDNVDIIFNGHTHQNYTWMSPYGSQDNRPVVQVGSYGSSLGQVAFAVDNETGAITFDQQFVRQVPTTTMTATDIRAEANPVVMNVDRITQQAIAVSNELGAVQVGEQTNDITTAFANDARDDRANASTLGRLVATMYRDASAGRGDASIGVVNPGGLRDELLYADRGTAGDGDGVITRGEVAATLPFANNIWTADLTGAQFHTLLEQQWQLDASGTVPSRPYLQLGLTDNVTYLANPAAEQGSRVSNIFIDGVPIDESATYRVAMPVFLLGGGDNFHVLRDATNVRDTGLVDSEAFETFIGAQSPLSADFSRNQFEVAGLPEGAVTEGDRVEFSVSKVALTSRGAPAPTAIEVFYNNEAIGSFAVDNGVAAVSFEAPAPVEGAVFELRSSVGASGARGDAAPAAMGDEQSRIAFAIELEAKAVTPTPSTPAPTSPAPSEPAPSASAPGAGSGGLPSTGAEFAGPVALLAVLLLAAGAIVLGRRKALS